MVEWDRSKEVLQHGINAEVFGCVSRAA